MNKNYIPIEKVIQRNEHTNKFEKNGLIITANNIEDYLKQFERVKSEKPSESYWEDKRIFISGIAGFAGSYLAESLLELGAEVHGCEIPQVNPKYNNIQHFQNKISISEIDLTDIEKIISIFRGIQPQHIFHLAAISAVVTSFKEPSRVIYNNIGSTVNIFEAARICCSDLETLQVACSSEQYGIVNIDNIPIVEDLKINPFKPRNVYGITKVATEHIASLYNQAYGIPSVITRSFNHEGPRRGLQFFTSVVHRQIAKILEGKQNNIIIGNPNVIRDFSHVLDTIRAYILICERGKKAEPYNIASGKGISIGNYVKICENRYNLDVPILIDPDRMRPSEVPILIGSNEKIKNETGWAPLYPITKIMEEGVKFFKEYNEFLDVEM